MNLFSYSHRETVDCVHSNRKLCYFDDRPYLDSARAAIELFDEVPDLALFAGVLNQVPFSLVVLE